VLDDDDDDGDGNPPRKSLPNERPEPALAHREAVVRGPRRNQGRDRESINNQQSDYHQTPYCRPPPFSSPVSCSNRYQKRHEPRSSMPSSSPPPPLLAQPASQRTRPTHPSMRMQPTILLYSVHAYHSILCAPRVVFRRARAVPQTKQDPYPIICTPDSGTTVCSTPQNMYVCAGGSHDGTVIATTTTDLSLPSFLPTLT
jgi:hypothetical protein